MANKKVIVVGCGLSGAVVARELANAGYKVHIIERRNHIGGNMFDYIDENGILVHKYGPHTFHTTKKELYDYVCNYGEWNDYKLMCGAVINNKCVPTPFNFETIDTFFNKEKANSIKKALKEVFPDRDTITVLEALRSENAYIREYANFLFENDYRPYSAKQWGLDPREIDPSILKRVPLRLNYDVGYFEDKYQAMPKVSYVSFFEKLLDHQNISIELNANALERITIVENVIHYCGKKADFPILFTGPIDELFSHCFGVLPYRSLRFDFKYEDIDSKQEMPVVAYPQAEGYVRIIEYKKLPYQNVKGTTYEEEYSSEYVFGKNNEPYYPLLTEDSQYRYSKYKELAAKVDGLFMCGRLGDFKYYNMDQAIERALETSSIIKYYLEGRE